jgi:ANTAR domain
MSTMRVIEQAKGIVMAQQGCGPEEAFDLLRRVSQRTNVKLHVLAEQIVEQVASSSSASNVTPSRWAARGLGNRQRGRAMTRSARFRRGVASRS